MSRIGLTIGIILIAVGSILTLTWYPVIGVDSAADAAKSVEGTALTDGISIKFKGRISGFDSILGFDVLYIEGFQHSGNNIPIVYDRNASLGTNDEVLVEGKYVAVILWSFVSADTEGDIRPASIQKLPLPLFYLAVLILTGGVIVVIVGMRTGV
ncbi:MAG: hypothetical protein ACE5QF_08270 [Thermoplasmata archaeon]